MKKENATGVSGLKSFICSEKLHIRIISITVCFLLWFLGITILSYYLLPEGFLINKNELSAFQTSENWVLAALQIFLFNMIATVIIILASSISKTKRASEPELSLGFLAFFVETAINAVTLGTWSFSVQTQAVPLLSRIVETLDITHRAGLMEMLGQLLIMAAFMNKGLLRIVEKEVKTRSLREIKISKSEIAAVITGLGLMLIAALIESHSIASVAI